MKLLLLIMRLIMNPKRIPFPQADDFEKVLKIINIPEPKLLKDTIFLCTYFGDISSRQVSYYLSACEYIGIIQRREFTNFGTFLRTLSVKKQYVELAKVVLSDDLFSEIYFVEKVYAMKLDLSEIVQRMKLKIVLNTEDMYKRRAQTVSAWITWFNVILNDIFEN